MQSLEMKSSRPKSFETKTRPETFETETPKNGSRDTITANEVARLYFISTKLFSTQKNIFRQRKNHR